MPHDAHPPAVDTTHSIYAHGTLSCCLFASHQHSWRGALMIHSILTPLVRASGLPPALNGDMLFWLSPSEAFSVP
jgi:hypothetical protein